MKLSHVAFGAILFIGLAGTATAQCPDNCPRPKKVVSKPKPQGAAAPTRAANASSAVSQAVAIAKNNAKPGPSRADLNSAQDEADAEEEITAITTSLQEGCPALYASAYDALQSRLEKTSLDVYEQRSFWLEIQAARKKGVCS